MRIEIAAFTRRGEELGMRVRDGFDDAHLERCDASGGAVGVRDWVAERFRTGNALVFIGAAGIAVRAISPHVADKTRDPAVVVLDETGSFVIPLLSGHLGGANDLARRIAGITGAREVITTATDGRGVFAVDEWARKSGFAVANPGAIKTVSSALLDGREVFFRSAFPLRGNLPEGVTAEAEANPDADADTPGFAVSVFQPADDGELWIVPPAVTLGVGCRRGVAASRLEEFFVRFCRESLLSPLAVRGVASIDLKQGEAGLLEFCRAHAWELRTFSADELSAALGDFSSSEFVSSVTGVDNVSGRAAVLGSGGGTLVVGRFAGDGIVMAAALTPFMISFGET